MLFPAQVGCAHRGRDLSINPVNLQLARCLWNRGILCISERTRKFKAHLEGEPLAVPVPIRHSNHSTFSRAHFVVDDAMGGVKFQLL